MTTFDGGPDFLASVLVVAGPLFFLSVALAETIGVRERLAYRRYGRTPVVALDLARERPSPRPVEERSLEPSAPLEHRTRQASLVLTGLLVANAATQRLPGERWWRKLWGTELAFLVVEEDGVFDRYWCIYEVHELMPCLLSAFPFSEYPTIAALADGVPDRLTSCAAPYAPWRQVPAFVDRSLAATAAWVERQGPLNW